MLKVREDGQLWFTRVDEAKKLYGSSLVRYLRSMGYTSLPEGTIMTVKEKGVFQLERALDLSFVDDFCYLAPLAGAYKGIVEDRFIPFELCGLPTKTDLEGYEVLKIV